MNFSPTRNLNGIIKQVVSGSTKTPLGMGVSHRRNIGLGLFWLSVLFLSGCAGLKKAAIISGVSTVGAVAGSALSGSVGAGVGALTGATVGQVVATALPNTATISEIATVTSQPITAETVVAQAPTNIWDVVSQLGLWAGLIILIPLVLGILLPGPVKFKGKEKS